jgi:hypothetical protein
MRIERGQHAVDRAFDQRVVADVVDIVAAHLLEHVAEQVELLVGLGRVGRSGRSSGGNAEILLERQYQEHCGERNQA